MKTSTIILFILVSIPSFSQNPLKDFNFLDIPRNLIPIGAEWIDGIGPNGKGVVDSLIRESKSLSSINIESEIKEKLDVAILQYVGLSIDYSPTSSIEYENMSIYTVDDISQVPLKSGQNIIYEALRADSIRIRFHKELDSEEKISIVEKLNLKNSTDFTKTISISGHDIFFAYRVIKLGKVKSKTKRGKIRYDEYSQRHTCKIENLELEFNMDDFYHCIDSANGKYVIGPPDAWRNFCYATAPLTIIVANYGDIDISRGVSYQEFLLYEGEQTIYPIVYREDSRLVIKSIVANWFASNTAHFDIEDSRILIKKTTVPIENVSNVDAPEW